MLSSSDIETVILGLSLIDKSFYDWLPQNLFKMGIKLNLEYVSTIFFDEQDTIDSITKICNSNSVYFSHPIPKLLWCTMGYLCIDSENQLYKIKQSDLVTLYEQFENSRNSKFQRFGKFFTGIKTIASR